MKKKNVQIGIVCALPEEFEQLSKQIQGKTEGNENGFEYIIGTKDDKSVVLVKSRIGATRSSIATTWLIENYNPAVLLFSGIAGALDSELKIGDVVVGKIAFQAEEKTHQFFAEYWPPEPIEKPASSDLIAIAENVAPKFTWQTQVTTLVSSEYFPAPPDFEELFKQKAAVAIDMESAAFYKTCKFYEKLCLAIRSISNSVTSSLTKEGIAKAAENATVMTLQIITEIPQKLITEQHKKENEPQLKNLSITSI